jgi:hypothetical protein
MKYFLTLPIGYLMSTVRPELRTPVMIVVDASWQDGRGVLQTAKARMEDKSAGGACLRLKSAIAPGTKLRVQWRFEQFSGTVKYCRSDGREFLAGIQRDAAHNAAALSRVPEAPAPVESKVKVPGGEPPYSDGRTPGLLLTPLKIDALATRQETEARDSTDTRRKVEPDLTMRRSVPTVESPRRVPYEIDGRARLHIPQAQKSETDGQIEIRTEPPAKLNIPGSERKPMANKWQSLMPWREKQGDPSASPSRNDQAATEKESIVMSPAIQPTEKTSAHAREVPTFEVELLAMEDIYRAAGIPGPRKGYSVNKVVQMLNSEHIRGLSKEMKRAAVLMALDAAGVSIDQVQRDAKARQGALDAYEAEQKKLAEADWTRKAEEIVHIQAEMESIKAHYMARIKRNQEAVARDKARFSNWVATKQQEAQSMTEALDLCLKSQPSQPAEPVSAPPAAEFSMAVSAGLAAAPASGKTQ